MSLISQIFPNSWALYNFKKAVKEASDWELPDSAHSCYLIVYESGRMKIKKSSDGGYGAKIIYLCGVENIRNEPKNRKKIEKQVIKVLKKS